MTFVLGLTGEGSPADTCPRPTTTPGQTALAEGAKVLNRYNCTGCHVLEMPKFTIPEGVKVAEAFTDFKTNLRASYTNRANDYLAELYPSSPTIPTRSLTPTRSRRSWGSRPTTATPVTMEGMPIGLFENELTVQLWKPVTIRGYTFNVGDNVTLDQTKIQKTDAVGGNFAWLYSTYQADRTGTRFAAFWNRLPPPLVREGNKVQTPWLTSLPEGSLRRSARRSSCGCRGSTTARRDSSPRQETGDAGELLRRPRPGRFPLSDDSRAEPGLPGRAQTRPIPTTSAPAGR